MKIIKTSYLIQQEEKKKLSISTQVISLGSLIIEFHSESVVQLPKSSPLCADVGVIREIKDCGGIKYPRKKGQARWGDASFSRSSCRRTRARRRDWHPVEGRKNSVEETGTAGQMHAYHLYALAALLLFQDFYNWGEAVSRINALTEGRIGQLFNGIVITCSLGGGITFAIPLTLFSLFYFSSSAHFLFLSSNPPSILQCFILCIFFFLFVFFSPVDRQVVFSCSLFPSGCIIPFLYFLVVFLSLVSYYYRLSILH